MNTLEEKIISNLLYNSDFAAKVIPYTKEEYFEEYHVIADEIYKFFGKYGCSPTKDELKIEIQSRKGLTDKERLRRTLIWFLPFRPMTSPISIG